jgi:hypothetical protein
VGELKFRVPIDNVPKQDADDLFGERKDPLTKEKAFHGGIDYPVAEGTKVYAAERGKIVRAAYNFYFGHLIIIDHTPNAEPDDKGKERHIYTLYAHLGKTKNDNPYKVSFDAEVRKGQEIGLSGGTGYRSTGNHLHFSIVDCDHKLKWGRTNETNYSSSYLKEYYKNPAGYYNVTTIANGTLGEVELTCEELAGLQGMVKSELAVGERRQAVRGIAYGREGKLGRVIVKIPTFQEFLQSIDKSGYEGEPPKLRLELTNAFTAVASTWLPPFIVEVNGKDHGILMPGTRIYELDWKSLN